jgi:hypothetical protein
MVEIKDRRKRDSASFGNLDTHTNFEYEGRLYSKIDVSGEKDNSFSYSDCRTVTFTHNTIVIPVTKICIDIIE